MPARYAVRVFRSTYAVALACLRQSVRQQWFMLVFLPFATIVLAASFLPAPSPEASYRLIIKVVLGGGGTVLFLGVLLTSSLSLPAETRDRTVHRSAVSPGGRLAVLTGRMAAFSLLAALAAIAGIAGTLTSLGFHSLNAQEPDNFSSTSPHFRALAANEHGHADIPFTHERGGVLWIDEELPSIDWIFPESVISANGLRLRVVPVVASALETRARIVLRRTDSEETLLLPLELFDNRPTDVGFPCPPEGVGNLLVRIERLSDSAPFGFDLRRNEFNLEKNGVSLLAGTRPFALNLCVAWFVVWLKLSFVASIAVFVSTFLSASVSAAFALVLFLLANALGFLREFAAGILKPAGCGCVHCHFSAAEHVPTAYDKAVSTILDWFTTLYPDLSRFDSAEALIWGTAIPAGFVLMALLYYLAYGGVLYAASALILRRREF